MDIITKKSISQSSVRDNNGNAIKHVSPVTLLGVKFCANMKWNIHMDTVVKKCSKRMFLFYNLVRAGVAYAFTRAGIFSLYTLHFIVLFSGDL